MVSGWDSTLAGNVFVAPPGFVFLLAICGSFLCCCQAPAAPAAGEIWVQKKRVVSDAPEAWFVGCSFMDFSLFLFLWNSYLVLAKREKWGTREGELP